MLLPYLTRGFAYVSKQLPGITSAIKGAIGGVTGVIDWAASLGVRAMPILGKLRTLGVEIWGDIQSAAAPVVDWLATAGIPGAIDAIGGLVDKAAAFYHFIKNNWSWIGPIVIGLTAAFAGYQLTLLRVAATKKAVAIAQWALNAAMNANPIGLLVTGIGLLIAGGIMLVRNWDTVKQKAFEVWGGIKQFAGGAIDGIKRMFRGLVNNVIQGLNFMIRGLNHISFDVPAWVPVIGGKKWGFGIAEIPLLARGTSFHAGGPAIVGEKGPELVKLPRGSQVIPNSRIGSFARPIDITININGSNLTADEVIGELVPKLKWALANSR